MDLTGTWVNELGSELVIGDLVEGTFSGSYVTRTGKYQGRFFLNGRCDYQTDAESMAIGWTVCWFNDFVNAHSVTTWSGQLYLPTRTITALWLLTEETSASAAWGATRVGLDSFRPVGASSLEAAAASATSFLPSHPL